MSEEIKNIINANKNGNLAVFIGAGISKSSETDTYKALDWNELIKNIKNEINELNETDFLKIAQYFYNFEGEEKYYEILENWFSSELKPSRIHEWLFNINPHIIITTNWDTLLEDTKEEFKQFYDVVCNDKELVESKLPHKIIKMHGDFIHKNIVFKEEDYLNYQNNFPLIENYVKSILSTHTVLFLGYSYNDVNLKLIIQWLRNNMQNKIINKPAMYITNFETHPNQITYFKNQGITTITLSDINNQLADINTYDARSRRVYTFLDKIFVGIDKDTLNSSEEINQFVLEQLLPFERLPAILVEQIKSALSNCGFLYDTDGKAVLDFYENLLTGDIDDRGAIRNVYKLFVQGINDLCNGRKPSESVIRIINILAKSDIKGIFLQSDSMIKDETNFLDFDYFYKPKYDNEILFTFDYSIRNNADSIEILSKNAWAYYNQHKLKESIICVNNAIRMCKTDKDFQQLFMLMFNFNFLKKYLRFEPILKEEFKRIPIYNIEQRYNNLTPLQQETVKPVYDFVNFTTVYSYLFSSVNDLNKISEANENIKSGDISYSSDMNRYYGRHSNLLHFILANQIMIEDYTEYKTINKNLVKIAILKHYQQDTTVLTRAELYSCIRYFDDRELKNLLQDYYKDDSGLKGKFKIDDSDKEWLIKDVLQNCAEQFILLNDTSNRLGGYIQRALFLLSLTSNTKDNVKDVFLILFKIISDGCNNISLFETINLFLGIQFNLFDLNIDDGIILQFIDAILNKIISGKINGYEYHVIEQNKYFNIYGYFHKNKMAYNNKSLVQQLLNELRKAHVSTQIGMMTGLLLPLYSVSENDIKDMIKPFIIDIDVMDKKEDFERIPFFLNLAVYGIKDLTNENILELNNFINRFNDGISFCSLLYTIDARLDYILKSNNDERFKEISAALKKIIEQYDKKKGIASL